MRSLAVAIFIAVNLTLGYMIGQGFAAQAHTAYFQSLNLEEK